MLIAVREIKEIVSIVRLVYCTLVDNCTCIYMLKDGMGGVRNCVLFLDAPTYMYGCGDRLNWLQSSTIHLSELFTYPNELLIATSWPHAAFG